MHPGTCEYELFIKTSIELIINNFEEIEKFVNGYFIIKVFSVFFLEHENKKTAFRKNRGRMS